MKPSSRPVLNVMLKRKTTIKHEERVWGEFVSRMHANMNKLGIYFTLQETRKAAFEVPPMEIEQNIAMAENKVLKNMALLKKLCAWGGEPGVASEVDYF